MMTRLTASDGHAFDAWIEPARGPRRGGLVILQEIFGLTDQLRGVARAYAAQGYEVAVPALFDRQRPGAVIPFEAAEEGRALMLAARPEEVMRDVAASVAALAAAGGKVGVLGFCWGGGLALRAAQTLDIAAAVSFYGTRLASYLDRPLRTPVQGHFGRLDDHAPPALVAEARAGLGPEFEVFFYEAGHAFANEARPAYVPEAAEAAHARAAAFLARHLAPAGPGV